MKKKTVLAAIAALSLAIPAPAGALTQGEATSLAVNNQEHQCGSSWYWTCADPLAIWPNCYFTGHVAIGHGEYQCSG